MKKESAKHNKVMSFKMSSVDDVRAFARSILLQDGVDIDMVNIKQDGVTISSFKKLVLTLYQKGYDEGFEQRRTLYKERRRLEDAGAILTKHQRTAKYISEHNLGNK